MNYNKTYNKFIFMEVNFLGLEKNKCLIFPSMTENEKHIFLRKRNEKLEIFLNNYPYFIESIGTLRKNKIKNKTFCLLADSEINALFKPGFLKSISGNEILLMKNLEGIFNYFQLAAWFIKDNCIDYHKIYYYDIDNEVLTLSRTEKISNSEGQQYEVLFNKKDIDDLYNILVIIVEVILENKTIDSEKCIIDNHGLSSDGYISDFDMRRINGSSFYRSFTLLSYARSQAFLPIKISFYISVLETLLVIHGDNIQKLKDRTARLLHTNLDERLEVSEVLKNAYAIRSSTLHGSPLSKKQIDNLVTISVTLDNIVREIFTLLLCEHRDWNYSNQNEKEKVDGLIQKHIFLL